jgi:hypothetical protein
MTQRRRRDAPRYLTVSTRLQSIYKPLLKFSMQRLLPPLRNIFYLPTELIAMMAGHLCDRDIYNLTRVSHRMASIACPLYSARKKLTFSSHTNTVSVRGEAYKALDVWRRSPGFSTTSKRLDCSFSLDSECAALQVALLHGCFNAIPSYPWTFFDRVRLTHVQTKNISDLLRLVRAAAAATVCSEFTISGFSCHKAISATHGRAKKGSRGKKVVAVLRSSGNPIVLNSVQVLRLTRFSLSPSEWDDFLSSLYLPSLHVLEIWNASSAIAIFRFLQRHPNVRDVQFFRSQWEAATLSLDYLSLPHLQTLHGYLYQTVYILECLLLRPSLSDLVIEANPLTDLRQGKFFDEVVRCLTMCQGSPTLQLLLPKQSRPFPLTLDGARARAARKLRSNELPEIESLCIGFVNMDDSIPVRSYSVNESPPILTVHFLDFMRTLDDTLFPPARGQIVRGRAQHVIRNGVSR